MSAQSRLRDDLRDLARRGVACELGGRGPVDASAPGLGASGVIAGGVFEASHDALVASAIECARSTGLVVAVGHGNFKDESTAVASALFVRSVARAFADPLLGEADVSPLLQRAFLDAHDAIVSMQAETSDAAYASYFARPGVRVLAGIGASAVAGVVLPGRAYVAHVGECAAVLVRDARARRLTLAETLDHSAEHRSSGLEASWMRDVVLRVLGMSGPAPTPVISRVDLRSGDRLVFANGALDAAGVPLDALASLPRATREAADALASTVRARGDALLATVAVADVA